MNHILPYFSSETEKTKIFRTISSMDNNNFCPHALKQAVAQDRKLEGEAEIQFSRRPSSRRRNPLPLPQVSPANGPPEALLGLFQERVL